MKHIVCHKWKLMKYLLFIILMAGFFTFYKSKYLLWGLIFVLILPFLSVMFSFYAFRYVNICWVRTQEDLIRTKTQALLLKLTNKTWYPISKANILCEIHNHYYTDRIKLSFVTSVPAKYDTMVPLEIKSEHVGMISVYVTFICVTDYFGIFSISKNCDNMMQKNCLPSCILLENETTEFLAQNEMEQQAPFYNQFSQDYKEIRDYREGDSIRNIHWKLSARKDSLLVKEYEFYSCSSIYIIIELLNDNKGSLDILLELLYSLCNEYQKQRKKFTVVWYHQERKKIRQIQISSQRELKSMIGEVLETPAYEKDMLAYINWTQSNFGQNNFLYLSLKELEKDIDGKIILNKKEKVALFECNM